MALIVGKCSICERIHFENGSQCPHCNGVLAELEISGRGKIYSFTRVHMAPLGMNAPYLLALIDLEGAGRVLGRIEDLGGEDPSMDAWVRFKALTPQGPRFRLE